MPTIAKTKRYQELNYRYFKLIQIFSVMSELRLHTNKSVNTSTADYYHHKLYVWGDYGHFLGASLGSMRQVFYIELDGFIGGYWDKKHKRLKKRNNEDGSLAWYFLDGKRATRKKAARELFESLLKDKSSELSMIRNARYKLAHYKMLADRNSALVPGGSETREILNGLAEVLYLLGYQRGNRPHYIEQDDDSTDSTQQVIDKLVGSDQKAESMRTTYAEARAKWFDK